MRATGGILVDQTFALKLRFKSEAINDDGLGLYDGSQSFHGFAKALQLTTHAFLNDETVMKATALKGASLTFSSPRRGSILFDIRAKFSRKPKSAPLNADAYYDFTRVALARATGNLEVEADTKYVEQKLISDEPFFDELSEKLEGSLQQAHRSIDVEGAVVSLERPRSTLLMFDHETSSWVHTRDIDKNPREFTGNMTRFNTKTGNGRAYISELRKIIPVRKSDVFNHGNKHYLTWSLHGDNISTDKELVFVGKRVTSSRGETKRIILDDCRRA
ncbi:hypothetical protein [Novosphingobium sp. ZW T3_23]|uniref:hypothetical protein n=1 Tax=Novosphingobium sp. ZW T3_23 TaxID=3378084 RepID=UPI00385364B6